MAPAGPRRQFLLVADQAEVHRGDQRLRPVGRAELVVQPGNVRLGGGLADKHRHRDRRDGQPVPQEPQDLALARAESQPFLHGAPPGERDCEAGGRERGRGYRSVPDGGQHLFDRRGLGHERRHACLQRAEQDVVLVLRGQHHDPEALPAVPEVPGQPQAVTVGQGHVHRHHVRAVGRDHGGSRGSRPALGHDLDIRMLRDQLAQPVAGQRVAVNDGKTDRHGVPLMNFLPRKIRSAGCQQLTGDELADPPVHRRLPGAGWPGAGQSC